MLKAEREHASPPALWTLDIVICTFRKRRLVRTAVVAVGLLGLVGCMLTGGVANLHKTVTEMFTTERRVLYGLYCENSHD